jgi:hypothetical protein
LLVLEILFKIAEAVGLGRDVLHLESLYQGVSYTLLDLEIGVIRVEAL